jgi:hypothetical protein
MEYTITDFVIWAFFAALIGVLIGQSKGRAVDGLVLGVLLGPLGWLLIAVGPNKKPKCPDCGGVVVSGAKKCKNCGALIGFDIGEYEKTKANAKSARPRTGRPIDPIEEWERTKEQHASAQAPKLTPQETIDCPLCNASILLTNITLGLNECPSCAGTFSAENEKGTGHE